MIEYIKGELTELQPAVAIVETAGIGYEINITFLDYNNLLKYSRATVKLYVHEIIREDARILYGFSTREDRAMFRLLNGVSGVGPGTARLILSEMNANELQGVIATGNDAALKAVKGIGARTAQRIIVDLSNKIKELPSTFITGSVGGVSSYEEALGALVTLGFAQSSANKVLQKVYKETPDLSTEDAIRAALKLF